ncbi:MAG: glycosyltransferase family 2 protein, partial [Bacteroidetes bacterium]|nr:glycosyltransferase family 2 protein [Bacteroidota bacterium]
MNDTDRVTVVIVNWNGKALLGECLESLRKQVYSAFSIILVDNGSQDGSVDFVKNTYPEIHVIALSQNVGFAAANNLALGTIQTDYVALLNNDAFPDTMWLNNLITALETHPEAGFVASKMLFYHQPDVIDRAGDAFTKAGTALLRGRGAMANSYNEIGWVFGACAGAALYRMSMLNDIGTFDKNFFLLYEDVDLSFRAQLKGYKCLFVPEAIVYHKGGHSIVHDSPVSVYYSHRNLEWVYIQNMPARLIPRTIIPHLIYNIAALCYFVTHGRGIDYLRAKKDALKGLKPALKKRRRIQSSRTVDDSYIWGLLDRPALMARFKGRRDK